MSGEFINPENSVVQKGADAGKISENNLDLAIKMAEEQDRIHTNNINTFGDSISPEELARKGDNAAEKVMAKEIYDRALNLARDLKILGAITEDPEVVAKRAQDNFTGNQTWVAAENIAAGEYQARVAAEKAAKLAAEEAAKLAV